VSADLSGEITAIATTVLAVFAIITAWYARKAFLKQSQEVRDQAEMLQVQAERLETYRKQVDEQHKINATYGGVLELQAREIRASLEERKHAAEEERRSQAAKVTA
jgi:hypothetical protein